MSTVIADPKNIEAIDFDINLLRAILWQYNNAPNLRSIINSKQDWYTENQDDFWTDWMTNIFDLQIANEFGRAVWSILLNIQLTSALPPSPLDKPTIGFNNAYFKNFNRGNFSTRTGSDAGLSPAMQKLALQFRYFQLCSSGTVPEINRFLKFVLKDYGAAFLIDHHDMSQEYVFLFPIPAEMLYLFNNYDILPRPAGVGSSYRDGTKTFFGFGPYRLNFNRGNFLR